MATPPLLAGAVKVMLAWPLPAVAMPMVGACGTVGLASNAPESHAAPCGRAAPRWSVAVAQVGARSRAGLNAGSEIVCVGPPLLASGFSVTAPIKAWTPAPL